MPIRRRLSFANYFQLPRQFSRSRRHDPLKFERLCAFLGVSLTLNNRDQLQDVGDLLPMPSLPPTTIGYQTYCPREVSVSHGRVCDLERAQNRNSRPRIRKSILDAESFHATLYSVMASLSSPWLTREAAQLSMS